MKPDTATSNVSISAPWPVIAAIVFGVGGVAGGGSWALPKFLGEPSPTQVSDDVQRKIEDVAEQVSIELTGISDALSHVSKTQASIKMQVARLLKDVRDISGEFGHIEQLSSRADRIANHVRSVDDRVRAIESNFR